MNLIVNKTCKGPWEFCDIDNWVCIWLSPRLGLLQSKPWQRDLGDGNLFAEYPREQKGDSEVMRQEKKSKQIQSDFRSHQILDTIPLGTPEVPFGIAPKLSSDRHEAWCSFSDISTVSSNCPWASLNTLKQRSQCLREVPVRDHRDQSCFTKTSCCSAWCMLLLLSPIDNLEPPQFWGCSLPFHSKTSR